MELPSNTRQLNIIPVPRYNSNSNEQIDETYIGFLRELKRDSKLYRSNKFHKFLQIAIKMLLKGSNSIKNDFKNFKDKEKWITISLLNYFKEQKLNKDLLNIGLNNIEEIFENVSSKKILIRLNQEINQFLKSISSLILEFIELNMARNVKQEDLLYEPDESENKFLRKGKIFVEKYGWFFDEKTMRSTEEQKENFTILRKLVKFLSENSLKTLLSDSISSSKLDKNKLPNENELYEPLKKSIEAKYPYLVVKIKENISGKSHIDIGIKKIAMEIKKIRSKKDFDEARGQILEDRRIKSDGYHYGIVLGIDLTNENMYLRFNKIIFFDQPKTVMIIKG